MSERGGTRFSFEPFICTCINQKTWEKKRPRSNKNQDRREEDPYANLKKKKEKMN